MVKICEYMSEDVVYFHPETPVSTIMEECNRTGHDGFPIVEDKVVGIITLRELVGAGPSQTAREIMTTPVITASPEDDLVATAGMMAYNHIHHLPLTENDTLVGIVTGTDMLRACIEHLISEDVEKVLTFFQTLHEDLTMGHGTASVSSLIPTQRHLDRKELKIREQEFDREVVYPIVVAKRDDENYIVDGHHRAYLALSRGMETIPIFYVEGSVGIAETARKMDLRLDQLEIIDANR